VDVGVWGLPVTSLGADGVSLHADGWAPLEERHRRRSGDLWEGGVRYQHRLAACDPATGIRSYGPTFEFGINGYYYPHVATGAKETAELMLAVRHVRIPWLPEQAQEIYAEAFYDFRRHRAVYARVGFPQELKVAKRDLLGGGLSLDLLDLSASVSNFPTRSGRDRGLGFHALEVGPVARWDSEEKWKLLLIVEGDAKLVWPVKEVGPTVGVFALRVVVGRPAPP
jgi:hypothetical protein